MKMAHLAILSVSVLHLNSPANAGEKGNGGTVYDCDDGKAYLVDLREPSLRRGLKDSIDIEESEDPVKTQVLRAFRGLDLIDPALSGAAIKEWDEFHSSIEWRPGGYDWKLSDDIGAVPVPDGCEVKNAVMYLSDREIEGQDRLRQRMSKTHRAALEVHEVLYKMMRDHTDGIDAVPARRLTALLFSKQKSETDLLGSLVGKYLYGEKGVPHNLIVVNRADAGKRLLVMDTDARDGFSKPTCEENPAHAWGPCRVLPPQPYGFRFTIGLTLSYGKKAAIWLTEDLSPSEPRLKRKKIRDLSVDPAAIVAGGTVVESFWLQNAYFAVVSDRLENYLDGDLRSIPDPKTP